MKKYIYFKSSYQWGVYVVWKVVETYDCAYICEYTAIIHPFYTSLASTPFKNSIDRDDWRTEITLDDVIKEIYGY